MLIESFLANLTPIVLGIISQKTNIKINVTRIAIIEMISGDSFPVNALLNRDDIKLVIATLIISSSSNIVAIIVPGLFMKDSNSLPEDDFFLIKLTWYLCKEKIELSVIEKKADNITFGEIVKIGILLPLTGENKTLGRSISNALEMALFETKSKNIKLLFKDSGDSLEKAKEAAQEAVKEGASMIIGPIFSYQASVIRENISIDIPIFSFTNDETIKTEGLWTLGFSPHQQIDAIFYEMSHHAVTDISIIVPTNIYGDIILQASRRASILRNIKICLLYTSPSPRDQRGSGMAG